MRPLLLIAILLATGCTVSFSVKRSPGSLDVRCSADLTSAEDPATIPTSELGPDGP